MGELNPKRLNIFIALKGEAITTKKSKPMNYLLKNYACIFLFLCSLSCLGQTQKLDSLLLDFYDHPEHILVAAHRAAHHDYPENSLAAIKESIRLGVDIIEIDVRLSKDGEFVLMHDGTVDRTTNGSGNVSDLDFSDLRALRLVHDVEITGERIPTFEELLKATKGQILIDVDFKVDGLPAAKKAYAQIEKQGMERQILFYIYDNYPLIPLLRDMNTDIEIMPRAYSRKDVRKILKIDGIDIIHVDESFYKKRTMRKIIRAGSRVWINALGKYDEMERQKEGTGFDLLLEKKYSNVIQTDLPKELLSYLKEHELRR